MDWKAPPKPAEFSENRLIDAILDGYFPIGSSLPAERDLALQLGVTRPTLREALQRLARDGWVEIRQGRPTRVRDYWREGNLGVLGAISRHSQNLPADFVPNLLYVRQLMAPAYARLAVDREPQRVLEVLSRYHELPDNPEAFATFDWQLHHHLTIASGNPVFTMILNGFCDLYFPMACLYFNSSSARDSSRSFYRALYQAAIEQDGELAEEITLNVMRHSLELWQEAMREQQRIAE
jgi:GntR family negative regulator for fad regulon and positive regulator of fabA